VRLDILVSIAATQRLLHVVLNVQLSYMGIHHAIITDNAEAEFVRRSA